MIYPQNFEQKIGFDQIREMIRERCISSMGEFYVDKIRFSSNESIINKLLQQISEFKHILVSGNSFPSQDYFDLRDELARIKTPGAYIEQEALFDLKTSFVTINAILNFFKSSDEDDYPELKTLLSEVFFPSELIPALEKIMDDKGEIRDNASDNLAGIRKDLKAKERQVFRETKKAFQLAKKSGWTPDDADITIRNGRAVIPLKVSDKRAMGGFIHDESASGQTVFIEPAISFEVSNQIRELENEERREIIRILTHFSDRLRPFIADLFGAYRFLGLMDFIRAKSLFSNTIKAEQPKLSTTQTLALNHARHPLLYLALRAVNKEVVPLNLELDAAGRILVISGPNAGGKSVCLKTIGLLQFMLQSGLHIPCSPDSSMPVFEHLFIDIGDEQSLENDLSTYSSHLLNMKFFLRKSNNNTLFLIDEFGSGTEPHLGGAIAEATLEQLNEKESFGVVTTHYSNLKVVAQRTHGIVNGAMLFDSNEMLPLYRLQIGNPGSSFAFEIAKNIGFPTHVLNKAKKKSGGKHVSFDKQLQQLEIDKINFDKKQKEVEATDGHLSRLVEDYSNRLEEIKRSKKVMIDEAKKEALQIIENSNKAIEKTIKEIKEAGAEKIKTKELRKELAEKKNELSNDSPLKRQPDKKLKRKKQILQASEKDVELTTPPKVGDYVRIKNTDIIGELINIEGKDAFVDVNDIKLKTSFGKLMKTNQVPVNKINFRSKNRSNSILNEINEKAANFSLSIDLRGKRVEEAIQLLSRYIDEAILLSIKEVNILHGKGDGILRPIIRKYLETVDEVEDFGDAPLDMGGAGITKVYF